VETSVIDDSDQARFEQQLMPLLDALYGAALRLANNRSDAEDLVAESVKKAWASRDELHDPGSFRGWLFRILMNTFLSDCRRRKTSSLEDAEVPSAGEDDPAAFSLFERLHQPFLLWWGTPEQEFLNRLLRQDLQGALDELPEVYRVVVVLSELQGFSYQEIATILEVPIGTVRSRLARGRGLLQKALWQEHRPSGTTPAHERALAAADDCEDHASRRPR
jgi:RNA polymerase sigma-70 factor (ECF subfamily)